MWSFPLHLKQVGAVAVDVDLVSGDSYIYILIASFFINLAGDLFVNQSII